MIATPASDIPCNTVTNNLAIGKPSSLTVFKNESFKALPTSLLTNMPTMTPSIKPT